MAEENSVKNIVLYELARKWPENVHQLHERVLAKRPGITYHAVHKAVSQLTRHGVLKKDSNSYYISPDWTEGVSALLENIKNSYIYTKPAFLPGLKDFVQEGETKALIFDNLEKADDYKKRLQWEYLIATGERKPYCSMMQHLRSPIIASEKALNILTMAQQAKSEAFVLVAGNTPLDGWCADYYRNEFVKVQTDIKCAETCETAVLGDIVIQVYIPDDLQKALDAVYSRSQHVADISMPEFYSIYRRSANIKFAVMKNAEIAQQLRNQILENFKRSRIAAFDINGTLVEGFLVKRFLMYLTALGVVEDKYLEKANLLKEMESAGNIMHKKHIEKTMELYARALKGKKREEIEILADKFIAEGMHSLYELFPFATRFFFRANSYFRTLAITKTTSEIMNAFLHILPFDFAITSELEVKNGVYTGRYTRNMAGYNAKKRALKQWLEKNGERNIYIGFGNRPEDLAFLEKSSRIVIVKSEESGFWDKKKMKKVILIDPKEYSKDILDAIK
ncbi:MAG: haloacid dehalogenase-like hydrolase [Candidatus Aenigmarchaeota archaeon]|nr:haloacid dehalogenase-like hydrolase [Candidatus Aenigmarchaeota archaeon]